jgi:F0F1-type ATP synthase membrane subunit b/b'
MDLMERTNERRRTFMKDRLEHKLDDAMRDRVRLEEANDRLQAELERDAKERDQMWAALEKGMRPQTSRLRRLMVLGVGAGAAYVVGAKAGRERYDQIMAWLDRTRGRATELQTDAQRAVSQQAEKVTGQIANRVESTTARTSDAIESSGQRAAGSMRSSVKDDSIS